MEWKERLAKSRAYREINLANLEHNIGEFKNLLPETTKIMAVVKGDAYGHGAIEVSKKLNLLGIYDFCVACLQEAIELRENKVEGRILILGYTDVRDIDLLYKYNLEQTVINLDYGLLLNKAAGYYGKKLNVHIKIDTGMNRLGEKFDRDRIKVLYSLENLNILASFSHLGNSDQESELGIQLTKKQIKEFEGVIKFLKEEGLNPGKIHLLSTDGILNYSDYAYDYVRLGVGMYGVLGTRAKEKNCDLDLRPLLEIKARVKMIKKVNQGDYIGYGLSCKIDKVRQIAIVSIGYGDGLARDLSGKGQILIKGKKYNMIGLICMDQILVDIRDSKDIEIGDIAIIIGRDGNEEIRLTDLAGQLTSISNEFLSRLGSRLGKVYLD